MSCRETASGSAITTYARLLMGRQISEPATLSTFHYLRNLYLAREPEDRRVYSETDYQNFLERSIRRVEGNAAFTPRQRESIVARLRAAQSDDIPDQATIYALHNLTPTMRDRAHSLSGFLRSVSGATGEGTAELRERFNTLAAGITRRNAPDYTAEGRELAASLGLPRDPGTVHAVQRLESERRHVLAARAAQSPQRVVRSVVADLALRQTGVPGLVVEEWGYDARNGRLEVVTYDSFNEEREVRAYRGVPPEVADSLAQHAGSNWQALVCGNPEYRYSDADEAAIDGAAPRCAECGQFANAQHACPQTTSAAAPEPASASTARVQRIARYADSGRWSRQTYTMDYVDEVGMLREHEVSAPLPAIRRLQQAVRSGPVEIALDYSRVVVPQVTPNGAVETGWAAAGSVSGSLRMELDQDGALQVDTTRLRCSCYEFRTNNTCPHVDAMGQLARDRYERPNAQTVAGRRQAQREEALREAAGRIERLREAAIATDWMRNPATAAEAAQTWRRDADVLYSEDPNAFRQDLEDALGRAAAKNGEPDIPYMMENALDGLCTRASGKGFGVEIEYEFPPNMTAYEKAEAQQRIGEQLYAAGLTYSDVQQPYRASQRRGVRDTHADANGVGNWSWERDGSVDGELVTPIMYDEPESWSKLETALRILRDNGATAGTRAGAHVHVGTADFNGSPAAYAELSRIVVQHEDVIARLASNPARGTHRNNGYSRPAPSVPPTGFRDVHEVRTWQSPVGRYSLLNVTNVHGDRSDHPEFRIFDSTLDPGSVQAQIKMAVGMTEAAKRNALAGGTTRDREPWGANYLRNQLVTEPNATPSVDDMVESSATTRSFIDMILRRREDKAQIASIFAHTRWTASSYQAN